MKDFEGKLQYRNKEYKLVFNLNTMQLIQEEYGSIDKWGELTDGSKVNDGEPNVKALVFGLTAMINEGIDIDNDEHNENEPMLTQKQVGRMVSEIGLKSALNLANQVVVESAKDDHAKNV